MRHGSLVEALERRALLSSAADPVIHPLASPFKQSLYAAIKQIGQSRIGAAAAVGVKALAPFTLNWTPLKAALAKAPLESAGVDGVTLPIPRPDGSLAWFEVVEAPITEMPVPGIKTFRGIGVDDLGASLRMDYTPAGFHAQVLSTQGTYFIDPYFRNDASGVYASYYKRDGRDANWQCVIDESDAEHEVHAHAAAEASIEDKLGGSGAITFGTQLRTFRAAVAADGEYTTYHGGTVALGQAAVVTAMNRVNGVYETELAIRLTLVANNNLLIYTNAGTDPYSNSSSDINVNTGNINSVIGSANYDIGHVFTTASGGVAFLACVGGSNKGGGTTGTSNPIGDAFTIDYVAHEMGHQFGAHHTFNTTNSNRSGSWAYEPGSGSTIMAYAGILGAENLQTNSDPYFHSASMDEIRTFVTGSIAGVGTTTSTGNSPPTVSAGANYTIPTGTPFALTASGSDPNGDAITFEWQERDLGPAALLTAADQGTIPLFRDWVPSTSPTRTLPRIQSILGGTNQTLNSSNRPTEKLFAVTRTSTWRVIARDNKAGGGGVSTADMTLSVVNTGSAFSLTSHNSSTTWNGGTAQSVTWNVAGTTANGINTANVSIKLSLDGGFTFPITLASNTSNDGSESITLPTGNSSSAARVKVEAVGNIFFDIGNANFTVTPTPPPGAIAGQTYQDRNADGVFNGNDVPLNGVVVYLDNNLNSILDGLEPSITTAGTGNYNFSSLATGNYRIRQQTPSGHVAIAPSGGAADVVVNSGATTTQNFFNFPYIYNGSFSTDVYLVKMSASLTKIEVSVGGVLTYSVQPSQVTTLAFNLGDASDTLEIDYANGSPIPSGGLSFDGQNGVNDILKLTGTATNDAITVNTAAVTFGGQIAYNNAERLIAVTQDGDDSVTVTTPSALAVQFQGGLHSGTINTLNINAGSQTINVDIGNTTANTVINVDGVGTTVTFAATQHLESLSVSGGATATLAANGSRKLVMDSLNISGTGSRLDLVDNDMAVVSGDLGSWTGSTYDGITGLIAAGFNGGAWDGDGIATTLSNVGGTTRTLAAASGGELLGLSDGAAGVWNGETINADSVVVKYTYAGDANLDGEINGDDYFNLDSNAFSSGAVFGYFVGDLNLDGEIDGDDYFWLDSQFPLQGPPL